jgi:hypothetical protein
MSPGRQHSDRRRNAAADLLGADVARLNNVDTP